MGGVAIWSIGTDNAISWWRVIAGGVLCGASICGMHYLGNTSIKNYTCVYQPAYVVGSAIIAVVASNAALFMLFVFRAMWTNSELFCLAAAELAGRFHEDLTSVGVLWDEILLTGPVGQWPRPQSRMSSRLSLSWGMQAFGRGLLMLLARRVESDQDAERFLSAGYRFAELHQVSNIIRSGMQIQSTEFETKLRSMSTYASKHNEAPSGVHVGFFAIRASVRSGFNILVQKDARNLLPSMALPLKTLENWHLQFLKRFGNMSVSKILQSLNETSLYVNGFKNHSWKTQPSRLQYPVHPAETTKNGGNRL
ncbi:uncharacterized protein FRV6_14176 [Fusarium oxysporum]|uniref:MHYT domain-containing protein n=1 Tax=Fusarium oxysporum TaxID=5507 RepID=A0A2H3TN28_FUSOX|nr:uncharacterized protein FRV6_14176 [Fusarium oxysporum]